jgi:hypothetical protein
MCDNKELLVFEKIGDYNKEAKRFIKGAVKSKLFATEENQVVVTIEKGEFDKKAKQGVVTLCTCCPVSGMGATYTIMAPTRVYNKVDATLFDTLVAQLGKMKTPITLVIE